MKTPPVVERVCRLASDFREGGTKKSIVQLLEESGYLQHPDLVTRRAVTSCLREHPEFVDAWSSHSCDQRSSGSWALVNEGRAWYVRSFGGPCLKFWSPVKACTEYVLREVARLRRDRFS